jgi:hypothetical protein
MPQVSNAIPGKQDLARKRTKMKRKAEQEFTDLPDWMFWEKSRMDTYIDNIGNLAEVKIALQHIGAFIRISVRLLEKYEERD